MNNELKDLHGEIDALAERWDDHGAFDFLDDDSNRAETTPTPSAWRRGARVLNRANLWWVPLAASVVVFFLAWQKADHAATVERMNAAAARDLADEKEAWQELQKERIRITVDRLKRTRAEGNYSEVLEYIDALESLGGWGQDMMEPSEEVKALVNESRAEVARKILQALGYADLASSIEDGVHEVSRFKDE